jgi:hypothetical protein
MLDLKVDLIMVDTVIATESVIIALRRIKYKYALRTFIALSNTVIDTGPLTFLILALITA